MINAINFGGLAPNVVRQVVFLSILTIAVLPTGSVYGFNIKICAIALLLLWFLVGLRRGVIDGRAGILALSPIVFLIFYFLLGLSNGYSAASVSDHLIGFLSVISLCVITEPRGIPEASKRVVANALIAAVFLVSFLKVLAWLLVLIGYWNIGELFRFVVDVFSYEFITLETDMGSRFHFPIDYLLPIGLKLYFMQVNYDKNINKIVSIILTVFVVLAIAISYSRLLYVYTLLTTLMLYRISIWKIATILIPSVLILYIWIDVFKYVQLVVEFLYERFFGIHASDSDSIRVEIFTALYHLFSESPIIGSGLGSHPSYIRFEDSPWNYELQTMSMVAQFGVIGFSLIMIYLSFYFEVFKQLKLHSPVLLMFILWMGVNSINCFFLISQGGCVLVAMRYVGFYMRKNNLL